MTQIFLAKPSVALQVPSWLMDVECLDSILAALMQTLNLLHTIYTVIKPMERTVSVLTVL